MSIDAMLSRLEDEGRLVRYLPPDGIEPRRGLYLSEKFAGELLHGRSAIDFFGQKRAVVSLFDRWVDGSRVTVRASGRGPGALLARLEPPPEDIWEFRVTEPRPQLRVFLRFAAPDVLVALLACNRDRLGPAENAHGKRSRAWLEAMYECEAEWNRIFRGTAAFRGGLLRDYVRENAGECT